MKPTSRRKSMQKQDDGQMSCQDREFVYAEGGRPAFREKLLKLYKEKGLSIIVLEPGVFDHGVKRFGRRKDGFAVVYDYEKTAVALARDYKRSHKQACDAEYTWDDAITDAYEWIDFNTIRSLPYMAGSGIPPKMVYSDEDGIEHDCCEE